MMVKTAYQAFCNSNRGHQTHSTCLEDRNMKDIMEPTIKSRPAAGTFTGWTYIFWTGFFRFFAAYSAVFGSMVTSGLHGIRRGSGVSPRSHTPTDEPVQTCFKDSHPPKERPKVGEDAVKIPFTSVRRGIEVEKQLVGPSLANFTTSSQLQI